MVFLTSLETHDTGPMYEAGVNAYVVKPASLPGLVWLWPEGARLLLPVAVALGGMWLVTLLFLRIHSRYRGHVTGLWIMEGLLALVASVPAFLL